MLNERQAAVRVLITVTLAFLIAVGSSILYTKRSTDTARRESAAAVEAARREAAEALQRWCDLLILIDNINSKQPTSSNPDITEYRRLIRELRAANNC
jgi:hypothetical protein